MKKKLVFLMFALLLIGSVASAAPVVEPLQTVDIQADNNVNIFDYNFMDEPGEARLELTQLANIWGGGAVLRVDIETDNGKEELQVVVSGAYNGDSLTTHMLSVSLRNKGLINVSIAKSTPLVLNVKDGKLTVAAGGSKRTVDKVYSFGGSLHTQSITGTLRVYPGSDSVNAGSLVSGGSGGNGGNTSVNDTVDTVSRVVNIFR
ncbi:MAG: hypothetical protein VB133_12035 [Anaeromusa sp.]|uniref:hypothetical protein n=1 Tax=Anaeromusa sp. TaxID=1872520 RepID=UPI002B1FBFE6|nr:hypothetical protein [Anaeromusa sp.]MEA4835853.1 hypothetical protein [Anaeromusa sp.]